MRTAYALGLPEPVGGKPKIDEETRDARRHEALESLRAGYGAPVLDAVMAEAGHTPRPLERGHGLWSRHRWHVVVPVRGRHDLLAECLEGLAQLRDARSFDVIVTCPATEYESASAVFRSSRLLGGVVGTPEPLGFAANCNRGVDPLWEDTDRVLFLNSDADPGPLGSLGEAFDAALDLADAAGPCGSNVSGFQGIDGSEPSAAWFAARPRAVRAPHPRLVGFALAVNLGAFRTVGGWDEGYGLGNFDDDDLSLRLALASPLQHKLAWVPSSFVRHVGSASFAALPEAEHTYHATMNRNGERFLARWGWCLEEIVAWWNR